MFYSQFLNFAVSDEDSTCVSGYYNKYQGSKRISIDGVDMHNEVVNRRQEILANGYILLNNYHYKAIATNPVKANAIWKKNHPDTNICFGYDLSQIYWKFT